MLAYQGMGLGRLIGLPYIAALHAQIQECRELDVEFEPAHPLEIDYGVLVDVERGKPAPSIDVHLALLWNELYAKEEVFGAKTLEFNLPAEYYENLRALHVKSGIMPTNLPLRYVEVEGLNPGTSLRDEKVSYDRIYVITHARPEDLAAELASVSEFVDLGTEFPAFRVGWGSFYASTLTPPNGEACVTSHEWRTKYELE